jgi:NADH:ubiquinone oxidoreductase subunit 6 (subunit J)
MKPLFSPFYKMNFKYNYQHYLGISIITAITAIIAIRVNEYVIKEENECKKNKNDSLRCKLINNNYYRDFELFAVTILATFLGYIIIYLLTGYGG